MSTFSFFTIALVIVAASADIDLGTCSKFALKAATRIAFNGVQTLINTGDIGVSPGNGLSGSFKVADGAILNTKESESCDNDLSKAFKQAMDMTCDAANNFPELAGRTLSPGVYCSGSSMKISAKTVTLDGKGDKDAQWVFQVATALTTATSTSFILKNGAQAKNVFWALGTAAEIAHSSSFVGNILAQTQVSFGSGSELVGRALAFTAIVFESGSDTRLPPKEDNTKETAVQRVKEEADFNNIGECTGFAVNAGTAVNFNGDVTKVSGNVGVSPGEIIQGNFEFTNAMFNAQRNTKVAGSCAETTRALFNKAQNLPCQANHTIQGNDLAGRSFTPGVYCSATGKLTFSAATITLDARGDPNAKFIFRTETSLTTATATSFKLINGAKSSNVFWAIGTAATLGYSSNFVGTIIAGEAVTVGTSTVVDGRALALAAVTFSDQGIITAPN